jgi:hypothetical protein
VRCCGSCGSETHRRLLSAASLPIDSASLFNLLLGPEGGGDVIPKRRALS